MFKDQPKGLIPAALSNMGERFGYYIMNAVLVLFLCSKFGLSEETSTLIYSFFYAGIYLLSLVGGVIADRTQNYKGTIISGLIVMCSGYLLLSIPILSTSENISWLLPMTCFALFLIAFGNGLFKGNLQAIVGQLYDNPKYASKRDSGFQIFYVFINVGGLIAPFVAPMLRSWWLGVHNLAYNAKLPALCHEYLSVTDNMSTENINNLYSLITATGGNAAGDIQAFCSQYLEVFNTGVHYSFIASVAAMVLSLAIFLIYKKGLPNPSAKAKTTSVSISDEERRAMAKEIKQRMMALFAVLGVVIFFWFSFHQNGLTLTMFAKEFTDLSGLKINLGFTSIEGAEVFQSINPLCVVLLTPVIVGIFGWLRARGKEPSAPRKIAIGMGIAALAFAVMAVGSYIGDLPLWSSLFSKTVDPETGKNVVTAIRVLPDAAKVTPLLLIGTYVILTVAELFISPLGISFVSKVAPPKYQGVMQGGWLGATAIGNQLLFIGAILYEHIPIWMTWSVFVVACVLSMFTMLAMLKWLERVTQ